MDSDEICGVKVSEWDPFHTLITLDELTRLGAAGVTWALIAGPKVSSSHLASSLLHHCT